MAAQWLAFCALYALAHRYGYVVPQADEKVVRDDEIEKIAQGKAAPPLAPAPPKEEREQEEAEVEQEEGEVAEGEGAQEEGEKAAEVRNAGSLHVGMQGLDRKQLLLQCALALHASLSVCWLVLPLKLCSLPL